MQAEEDERRGHQEAQDAHWGLSEPCRQIYAVEAGASPRFKIMMFPGGVIERASILCSRVHAPGSASETGMEIEADHEEMRKTPEIATKEKCESPALQLHGAVLESKRQTSPGGLAGPGGDGKSKIRWSYRKWP